MGTFLLWFQGDIFNVVQHSNRNMTAFGSVLRAWFSGALLGSDDGKGRPALLDVLAAAMRAHDLALLVVDERQDLREEFLAVMAEEFVVRHWDLRVVVQGSG
jgi:hypothetical protein